MITVLDGITYLPIVDPNNDLDENVFINEAFKGLIKGLENELMLVPEAKNIQVVITGEIVIFGNLNSIAGLKFGVPEDLSEIARGIIEVGDNSAKLRSGFILTQN